MLEIGDRVYAPGIGREFVGTVTEKSIETTFGGHRYLSYRVAWDRPSDMPPRWQKSLWFPEPMLREIDAVSRLSELEP